MCNIIAIYNKFTVIYICNNTECVTTIWNLLLWEGWTKLIKSICNVCFSIGVPHHRLLCLVRLEVLQEKAAQGQEERKGWEGKGDERNIRKHHFLDDNCQTKILLNAILENINFLMIIVKNKNSIQKLISVPHWEDENTESYI